MSQAYDMLRRCRRRQTVGLDEGTDPALSALLRREKIIDRMPEAPDSPLRVPEDVEGDWPGPAAPQEERYAQSQE